MSDKWGAQEAGKVTEGFFGRLINYWAIVDSTATVGGSSFSLPTVPASQR